MTPTVLFVHGAFVRDGSWWWRLVAERLSARGIGTRAVDLPSCGPAQPLGDFADDVKAVRAALDVLREPVILVGHSYGGVVITEAAAAPSPVARLVYISAVVPDHQSLLTSGWVDAESAATTSLDIREDGTIGEDPRQMVDRLLTDSTDEVKLDAMRYITRQAGAAYGAETTVAPYREIPATYVLCQRDGDVTTAVQRVQAARVGSVVELPTNHYPHLEHPDLVADLLIKLADEVSGQTVGAGSSVRRMGLLPAPGETKSSQ